MSHRLFFFGRPQAEAMTMLAGGEKEGTFAPSSKLKISVKAKSSLPTSCFLSQRVKLFFNFVDEQISSPLLSS
jgi:hypothetical protein